MGNHCVIIPYIYLTFATLGENFGVCQLIHKKAVGHYLTLITFDMPLLSLWIKSLNQSTIQAKATDTTLRSSFLGPEKCFPNPSPIAWG